MIPMIDEEVDLRIPTVNKRYDGPELRLWNFPRG